MRIRSRRPSISRAAVALAPAVLFLLGATSTDTMAPDATVVANCSIARAVQNVLGNYDPIVTNRVTDLQVATGVLTLQCTRGAPGVTVSISLGANAVGSSRYMKRASGLLQYNFYQDAGYSIPWDLTNVYTYNSTSFAATTLTVYTSVPAGQDVPANASTYTDTVTATVNF